MVEGVALIIFLCNKYMDVSLQLYHGDCLEVMKTIPNKSVDLILCDLPYGCLTGGGGQEKAKRKEAGSGDSIAGCSWDVKIDLDAFWKEVKRIRRSDSSPCIHFCNTKFGYDLIKSNEKEFRYDLVWDKQRGVSFLSANKKPMRSHEMIYVFSKVGAYYKRNDITKDNKGKRCILSVIQNKTSFTKGGHPTEKPSELYRFLIERYCPIGGIMLDPTAGSGNSVFTAYDMNRSAIGIEKDYVFYDKMVKRLD